ncbi:LapA family protein [Aquibacillus albus]|uniref:Integral membrane protein n=1 Tax=Aquibacillus albus TaxID=1168171 RepID=A0ABS2MUZ4_9BACI|nr:lipopolysaccharide assembly protein LapA domain-containing protein [Aquibacillus albus]MBM7569550.1 putative integral membrane protein [Aquibacillus albus]
MRGQTYIILALVFAVIVAIFAVINVEPVEVNYLFGTGYAPLILVILISVLMGGVITATVGIVRLIKLQKEIRMLKQENEKLNERIKTMDDEHELLMDSNQSPNENGQHPTE